MATIAIIINVILGLLILGLQIWMNIKLRFAKTQAEATAHAKNLLSTLGFALMNCIIIFILFREFTSAAPLDRKSLYFIISFSLTLFAIWFLWLLKPMLLLLGDLVTLHKLHISESHGTTEKGIKTTQHQHQADGE